MQLFLWVNESLWISHLSRHVPFEKEAWDLIVRAILSRAIWLSGFVFCGSDSYLWFVSSSSIALPRLIFPPLETFLIALALLSSLYCVLLKTSGLLFGFYPKPTYLGNCPSSGFCLSSACDCTRRFYFGVLHSLAWRLLYACLALFLARNWMRHFLCISDMLEPVYVSVHEKLAWQNRMRQWFFGFTHFTDFIVWLWLWLIASFAINLSYRLTRTRMSIGLTWFPENNLDHSDSEWSGILSQRVQPNFAQRSLWLKIRLASKFTSISVSALPRLLHGILDVKLLPSSLGFLYENIDDLYVPECDCRLGGYCSSGLRKCMFRLEKNAG